MSEPVQQAEAYFAETTADDSERQRLAYIQSSFDPKSIQDLTRIGVGPEWECLEVGAGGGSITRWLAMTVGTSGRVVATDLDTRFIADIEMPNVEVRRHNILEDELETDAFDLVHCRFLLTHFEDREIALERMVNSLRPGGLVMVEEPDFSTIKALDHSHPDSEYFDNVMSILFKKVTDQKIFDAFIGPRMPFYLANAGLSRIGSSGSLWVASGGDDHAGHLRLSMPILEGMGVLASEDALRLVNILSDKSFKFTPFASYSAWGTRRA